MPHSIEKMQQWRNRMTVAGFPVKHLMVGMRTFPYYVIDHRWSGLESGTPPLFTIVMTGELSTLGLQPPADTTVFGVSDAIDPDYQPFVVGHEVREYVVDPLVRSAYAPAVPDPAFRERQPNACLAASEYELSQIERQPALFRGYVAMRVQFFAQQRELVVMRPHACPASSLAEISRSEQFWLGQQELLNI